MIIRAEHTKSALKVISRLNAKIAHLRLVPIFLGKKQRLETVSTTLGRCVRGYSSLGFDAFCLFSWIFLARCCTS